MFYVKLELTENLSHPSFLNVEPSIINRDSHIALGISGSM